MQIQGFVSHEVVSISSQNVVPILDLLAGVCVDYLHLKIENIIFKQVMGYPLDKLGPIQGMEQLQLVVFDKTVCIFFKQASVQFMSLLGFLMLYYLLIPFLFVSFSFFAL